MENQIKIHINDDAPMIINEAGDESYSINFYNPPTKLSKCEDQKPRLKVDGLRWRDGDHYHLSWTEKEIVLGDTVTIEYSVSDKKATPLQKEEFYVTPEEECSFCREKKRNVQHLIKGGFFSYICDGCVDHCSELIEKLRKANK